MAVTTNNLGIPIIAKVCVYGDWSLSDSDGNIIAEHNSNNKDVDGKKDINTGLPCGATVETPRSINIQDYYDIPLRDIGDALNYLGWKYDVIKCKDDPRSFCDMCTEYGDGCDDCVGYDNIICSCNTPVVTIGRFLECPSCGKSISDEFGFIEDTDKYKIKFDGYEAYLDDLVIENNKHFLAVDPCKDVEFVKKHEDKNRKIDDKLDQ